MDNLKTIAWHNVKDSMPKENKYVLVETLHCKYPFCSAFWNGVKWMDADKTETLNVEYWAEVITPSQTKSKNGKAKKL